MSHQQLLGHLRQRQHPAITTLDEYYAEAGDEVLSRMCDVARRSPDLIDDAALEWASRHLDSAAGSFFALLINLIAKDEERRPALRELFRKHAADRPGDALRVAGHWLHEHCRLLYAEWIDWADRLYERNPEGSWGVLYSAAQHRPELLDAALLDRFELRRATQPRAYFITLFSLARHDEHKAPDYLARALRSFPEHPAEAVDAAAYSASDDAPLVTPAMIEAMLLHFAAAQEKAWEYFERAVKVAPALYDDGLLDRLNEKTKTDPGKLISITRKLIDAHPDREARLMDRYVALVRRFPEKGIHDVRYDFQRTDMRLVRRDLVQAVCAGFAANAYPAYEFLWDCVTDRPELIGPPEVEAALKNIEHATNRAFGFFKELVKLRPEFTREGTLALFEALAQEPVHRAFVRQEEMEGIIAISEAAHVKTGLENALREPLRVGSRRARALMAIMFRQKLRARRHVLLEALRYAGNIVLWRNIPGTSRQGGGEESEKYSPVWDFLMFIIDNAGQNAVSTAAAERFLEGAFQLHYLCQTGAEHGEFLRKLDTGYPPPHPFPPGTEFLAEDTGLAHLYRLVIELGKRFGAEPRLVPLKEFAERAAAAERELEAVEGKKEKSDVSRRRRLGERHHSLRSKIAFWKDPAYLKAFTDPAAEQALSEEGRVLLRREKKDLIKQMRDALRAEAIQIAVAAVERSRLDLYRKRLKDALGRDVDLGEVEPRILPAFLWFPAISSLRNNTKYLRRLIEDRLERRPHDWLRTEPPVLEWAEQVRKGQPGVVLENWRATFEREFNYRPKDALAEKRRRIKADLAQARILLEKAGAKGLGSDAYDELAGALAELRKPPPSKSDEEGKKKDPPPRADPALLEEVSMNLERVRLAEQTPDSDFEGRILLTVETDPFEILFMGEYGFASCLSLRGSNAWSAVSNAIDIDKAIVWAKEPGGNVVGRRLLALTPEGVVTLRTYTNRHGLALDRAFDEFVAAYTAHCGVKIARGGHPKPLLSDRWYDDGAL